MIVVAERTLRGEVHDMGDLMGGAAEAIGVSGIVVDRICAGQGRT